MPKAIFNDTVIAESDATVVVEGNHYFPSSSVKAEYLQDSSTTSVCPWKGTSAYKNVVVDDVTAADGAWFYPEPKDAASEIKDHFAFWNGVQVVE